MAPRHKHIYCCFLFTSDESSSLSKFRAANMVGCENSVAIFQLLFKSWPIKLHRLFPRKTPSGLIIGMILNTKFSRKITAMGCEPRRNSKKPWQTYEVTDSPGCDLAKTTITRMKCFESIFSGFGTWSTVINSNLRCCWKLTIKSLNKSFFIAKMKAKDSQGCDRASSFEICWEICFLTLSNRLGVEKNCMGVQWQTDKSRLLSRTQMQN